MSSYVITDDIVNLTASVSLPFYFLYLPQAETISGEFVYNYYTRNEGVSEVVLLDAVDAESDEYNFIVENWEANVYPRQIDLQFANSSGFAVASLADGELKSYIDAGKITYEESPFNSRFSGVIVSDTAVDQKVYSFAIDIEDSETESSDILNVAKLQSAGYGFSKAGTRESVVMSYENDIKSIILGASINNLVVYDLLKTATRWQSSFYTDEYASILASAQPVQASAISEAATSDLFTISDDKINDVVLSISSLSSASTGTSSSETISEIAGFIIEKYGEQLDGSTLRYPDIILEATDTTYTDTNVRYGGVYKYKIRTVYRCTFVTISGESEEEASYVTVSILVASSGTQKVVSCVETSPPLPPNNITFQQTLTGLYIRWNFPLNTQKDIKRFQIFRRKRIEDPFVLQKEINFDKTIYPYSSGESIPDSLIQVESGPVKHYLDNQFSDLDDDYIYALCSIDAHGLSSGYSDQYRVRFDKFTGKLIVTRISTEGAPKPFPNVNILGDFFSDIIKDSGHSRIRLYFDPEYNDVTNSDGSSLSLISTTSTGDATYKIGITELNLGQSQTIDIVVNDASVSTDGIPVSIARFYTAS